MPEPDPVPEPKPGLRWLKAFWLVTCFVVVALLIASHITLISLWASGALDKHIFSISKVNSMTQFMTIAAQAWVTLLLVVLNFAVQRIAADRIIRRGQTVAALQDRLDSWKGFGASLMSTWRGRHLGSRLRLKILTATAFFAGASVLQISTPSVVTVSTVNTTETIQRNVTTMPGNIIHLDTSRRIWTQDPSTKEIITSMPFLWNQLASGISNPTGLNGSTLETPQNNLMTFYDPHARNFNVACASIPRSAGDTYNISLVDGELLTLTIQSMITPMDGVQLNFTGYRYYMLGQEPPYQLGGEKPTKDSPPSFAVPDDFFILDEPDHTDFAIVALAVTSLRYDAVGTDSTRGILPPIALPFQAEVRSWVRDHNASNETHPFLENGTFTVYVWPIGCSLRIDNITAEVQGNKLLSSTSRSMSINHSNLFKKEQPTDPLLTSWGPLIDAMWFSEVGAGTTVSSAHMAQLPERWLENILYKPLNSSVSSPIGRSPSVAERMAATEDVFAQVTGLVYGMLIQWLRSQALAGNTTNWKPTSAIVTGQQGVLRGKFVVNGFQVVVGTICVCVLAFSVLFTVAEGGNGTHDVDIIRDGGVIDIISLVNQSALPSIIAGGYDVKAPMNDARREVAERTTAVFGNARLDTPERIHDGEVLYSARVNDFATVT